MDEPIESGAPAPVSIQERLYPGLTCFGCGPANPRGLHLRSFPDGEVVRAEFRPWPEHDNGFGFVNGGIIATVLDCHSGAAVYHATSAAGPDAGDDPATGKVPAPYVTAGLDVRYLRPSPLDEPLDLVAAIAAATPDQITVEVELAARGRTCAAASALWRRWRPRGPDSGQSGR
jgi:acyl-coenzyme A thioesterase PaaI-like protein